MGKSIPFHSELILKLKQEGRIPKVRDVETYSDDEKIKSKWVTDACDAFTAANKEDELKRRWDDFMDNIPESLRINDSSIEVSGLTKEPAFKKYLLWHFVLGNGSTPWEHVGGEGFIDFPNGYSIIKFIKDLGDELGVELPPLPENN